MKWKCLAGMRLKCEAGNITDSEKHFKMITRTHTNTLDELASIINVSKESLNF